MEGGRRISASPRPCSGRRVVAARKRPRIGGVDGFVNSVKKLQRREISSKRDRAFTMSDAQERFRNIRLQVNLVLNLISMELKSLGLLVVLRFMMSSGFCDGFGFNAKRKGNDGFCC